MRFLLFLAILGSVQASVNVRLKATWTETAIIGEIGEAIAQHGEDQFWKFAKSLGDRDFLKWSQRQKYEYGIAKASEILGNDEALDFLKLSTSIREFSPILRVHQSIADGYPAPCLPFLIYNNKTLCDISQLAAVDGALSPMLLTHEHVIDNGCNRKTHDVVVMYGELGRLTTSKMMNAAKNISEFCFVFRHFSEARDYPVSLSGYGVELSQKNTEYNAMDSAKKADQLNGFDFDVLRDQHAEFAEDLKAFREYLQKLATNGKVSKWLISGVGLQAARSLANVTKTEILARIEHLSQNFPSYFKYLAYRENVERAYKEEISDLHDYLEKFDVAAGSNALYLNGRKLDIERLDIFELMKDIRREMKLSKALFDNGFNDEKRSELLLPTIPLKKSLPKFGLNFIEAQPYFINNVEKDYAYMHMGKNIDHLLFAHSGIIPPIAKNFLNLVVFIDPIAMDGKTVRIVHQIHAMLNDGAPIRVGYVFYSNVNESISDTNWRLIQKLIPKITKEYVVNSVAYGNDYMESRGIGRRFAVLLNGYLIDANDPKDFMQNFAVELWRQIRLLQIAIHDGHLKSSDNIAEWWVKNPNIVKRISPRIVEAFDKQEFIDLTDRSAREFLDDLKYFKEHRNAGVTNFVVVDFETKIGIELAVEALKGAVEGDENVVLIPNPKQDTTIPDMNVIVSMICQHLEPSSWLKFVNATDNEELNARFKGIELNTMAVMKSMKDRIRFVRARSGLAAGENAIVSNSLIIRNSDGLRVEDFKFLARVWEMKGSKNLAELSTNNYSPIVYSLLGKHLRDEKVERVAFTGLPERNNWVIEERHKDRPSLLVTFVVNPASNGAQHVTPMVRMIEAVTNSRIRIVLNPLLEVTDEPVKRFYRYAIRKELKFEKNGEISDVVARFEKLPKTQLFTMSMITNEAWMVELKQAKHDLDNLRLDSVDGDVQAVYSLEHVLLVGSCVEKDDQPAAGLQFALKSPTQSFDTIVMNNFGYFQLKANPGRWKLQIRDELDDHRFVSVDGKRTNATEFDVVVDSFSGKFLNVGVATAKKATNAHGGGVLNRITSFFTSSNTAETPTNEEDEVEKGKVINVFSLASGHLYERFMRIMMVSVAKNTQSKVKFWLLKNYLSPRFKDTISHLAKTYGFEYEFVEYKWPKWLPRQTEKQRIMWGYKILFLDVMFPLGVEKIIYVDADQVVRSDLQELMDFDLEGAPYGYVPFCDSRDDMEGFRFWKKGYWQNTLRGRKYHISALYVVDLKRFREMYAGDLIRGQYYAFSHDPNSLANLDQDLPNSLVDMVPIKSLPQNWLWCETWCDDASKESAKTIDLCNNPKTKEPKLESAKRIVDEWQDYDKEVEEAVNVETKRPIDEL
ncbi:unnamed protein product [Caenorhabditis bovis]|uniref:UDP-glucose:glycoprotein glucosyltransferase n=1 Tax=Caenorhabditis bovis TaxID=2654633 RepID=A0A8S1FEN6_9PELO|nr:unnamed protein product [Caenorhabditis bovis]